jgi:hypothetical protein
MVQLQWWGYRHVNGTVQVKRCFDERDITEAKESPFVACVYGPFQCDSREDAIRKVDEQTRMC